MMVSRSSVLVLRTVWDAFIHESMLHIASLPWPNIFERLFPRKNLYLNVQVPPVNPFGSHFVKSLTTKPGILTLAMIEVDDGRGGVRAAESAGEFAGQRMVRKVRGRFSEVCAISSEVLRERKT